MKVTFCGTASSEITPPRAATSILVQQGDDALLLDCGPGSLFRILETGISLRQIRAALISHLHMDHVQGFPELLAQMVFPNGVIPEVQGPPGTAEYVRRAAHLTQLVSRPPGTPEYDTPFDVPVAEVGDGDERDVLGIAVRSVVVPHSPDLVALARRLEVGGRSLVFSGDVAPAPEIMVPLADGADLLVHEVYSAEGIEDWVLGMRETTAERIRAAFARTHSDLPAVCAIASAAGARKLVLTHLNPGEKPARLLAQAAKLFPREVVIAEDGLALEV
ncbi:MAG: hypothetical protein C0506_07155 [Anaerolinea sp.]|nr:hypothetical protein [Anaerolinea sp.]